MRTRPDEPPLRGRCSRPGLTRRRRIRRRSMSIGSKVPGSKTANCDSQAVAMFSSMAATVRAPSSAPVSANSSSHSPKRVASNASSRPACAWRQRSIEDRCPSCCDSRRSDQLSAGLESAVLNQLVQRLGGEVGHDTRRLRRLEQARQQLITSRAVRHEREMLSSSQLQTVLNDRRSARILIVGWWRPPILVPPEYSTSSPRRSPVSGTPCIVSVSRHRSVSHRLVHQGGPSSSTPRPATRLAPAADDATLRRHADTSPTGRRHGSSLSDAA